MQTDLADGEISAAPLCLSTASWMLHSNSERTSASCGFLVNITILRSFVCALDQLICVLVQVPADL